MVLAGAGAIPLLARSGEAGLDHLYREKPDLILLDLRMPDMDGWQTLAKIHAASTVPVIVLTAQGSDHHVVRGLEAGAVDYVVKPFSHEVLIARIRSALRRTTSPDLHGTTTPLDDGYLCIDPHNYTISVANAPVTLTAKEWKLLHYFLRVPDQLVTFDQILENVWGWEYSGSTQYVHVLVSRLRSKIEADSRQPRYLFTERGVGYRFAPPAASK